jgi:hypothetical protein
MDLVAHRLLLGLSADAITLIGALILTKEAFSRLRDVTANRVKEKFNIKFPDLPLVDQEKKAARQVVQRAYLGCVFMVLGFLLQALTRIAENHSEPPPVSGSLSIQSPAKPTAAPLPISSPPNVSANPTGGKSAKRIK